MLFDLSNPRRKRVIKVVYATLAILLGGGLVFFGVGSNTSDGGLLDFLVDREDNSGNSQLKKREEDLEKQVTNNPKNAAAWGDLVNVYYQRALESGTLNEETQTFNFDKEGYTRLEEANKAWRKYLLLTDTPDPGVANIAVQAFSIDAYSSPQDALKAQEIITENSPSADTYQRLAQLATVAGNTRIADLATQRAVEETPKAERKAFKDELTQTLTLIQFQLQQLTSAYQEQQPKVPFTEGFNPLSGGLSP